MRLMEMYQMMLKYPEVCIIVVFENIPTMRLELHASIERTIQKTADVTVVDNPEYGVHIVPLSGRFRKYKSLALTANQDTLDYSY